MRPVNYREQPIDYLDVKPRQITPIISLAEYVERIKRIKVDRWQQDFCDRLEASATGRHLERTWALVHAEGQLGKSVILAQAYVAWLLGHDPLHRVALATYNVTRSQRHSKVVIGIMNTPMHKAIFTDQKGWVDEKTSKEKWSTAARIELNDGQDSLNPVGLQSGLTGSGFDTLIIDDPYADQKEAFSETVRTNLQEFWDFTVMSRMNPYANVFGMFHRYHVEDLAGYLLDKGTFDYWRYATICDGPYIHEETGQKFDDPLGREKGEYISERRPPEYYKEVIKDKRVFSSMFQGRPSAEEGEFFLVNKMAKLSPEETHTRRQECTVFVRGWDNAATEKGGDYSVGVLLGMSPDGRVTIFDGVREQVESAGRDELQLQTARRDGTDTIITFPEDPGAAGKTAVFHAQQLLRGFTVVPRSTSGSKETRARSFASAVNSGMVDFGAMSDEFYREAKKELRNFPLSDHDDIVDACADAYNEAYERVSRGNVINGFTVAENIREWDRFEDLYGSLVPKAWTVYVGVKITPDANRPNSAVIIARASEHTGLDEALFIIAEYKEYTDDFYQLFDWLNTSLDSYCEDASDAVIWLHPQSEQFLATITQKVKCKVQVFDGDKNAGLTEINWYLKPSEPNSLGIARLYALTVPEQLTVARDSLGLYNLRQEAVGWGYNDKREPTEVGQVWDCARMVVHHFRTKAQKLSAVERFDREMSDKGMSYEAIEKIEDLDTQIGLAQARAIADRAFLNKQRASSQKVHPFRRR